MGGALTEVGGVWRRAVRLRGRASRQVVCRRSRQTVSSRERAIQRGQTTTGVKQVGLFRDLTKERAALLTADRERVQQLSKAFT